MSQESSAQNHVEVRLCKVQQDFIQLTRSTCPHGHEDSLYKEFLKGRGFRREATGSYYLQTVGSEGECERVMFTAHLDTADSGIPKRVTHRFEKHYWDLFVATEGKTLLGGDDKAGVAIILHMVRNEIPGTYVLYAGEEVGRIGSTYHAKQMEKGVFPTPDICVSFDRRGYTSVITHQMGEIGASEAFAEALVDQLNTKIWGGFEEDPTGSFTDSFSFHHLIAECTNISCGYFDAHSKKENQNLTFLSQLAKRCLDVRWQELPVERDPATCLKSSWNGGGYGMEPCETEPVFQIDSYSTLKRWVENNPDLAAGLISDLFGDDYADIQDEVNRTASEVFGLHYDEVWK